MILLSDGYLANGSEPWRLPDIDSLPDISRAVHDRAEPPQRRRQRRVLAVPPRSRHARPPVGDPRHAGADAPHRRDREGGRARGNIYYTPENHQLMVDLRAAKVAGIAKDIPPLEVVGDDDADLLRARLGLHVGVDRRRRAAPPSGGSQGRVGPPHPPQPAAAATSATSLRRFPKVVVPELNMGQLSRIVRAEYLVDAHSVSRSRACRSRREIEAAIEKEFAPMSETGGRADHEEGLGERPGGALVPGLRRLRHPAGRPAADARARVAPGEHRVRRRASAAPAASRTT